MLTAAVSPPEGSLYCQVRHPGGISLAGVHLHPSTGIRLPAGVPLLRLPVAAEASHGMLTVSPIGRAARLALRPRLTLIRLALIRKPWSFGEGVSRPLYRYLYLHLPFRKLHRPSKAGFGAAGMLPYQPRNKRGSAPSAPGLCPIIIHAGPLD